MRRLFVPLALLLTLTACGGSITFNLAKPSDVTIEDAVFISADLKTAADDGSVTAPVGTTSITVRSP